MLEIYHPLSLRRESLVLVLNYENLEVGKIINEVPYYGGETRVLVEQETLVPVAVNNLERIEYAQLRVGISRQGGLSRAVRIKFNDTELDVPHEDAAIRLDNGQDYATCKIIRLPADQILAENKVSVSFPDGEDGAIGSVVLRVSYREILDSEVQELGKVELSGNSIIENQPVGTIVGKLIVKDQDGGKQLSYKLVRDREQIDNELFSLDENGTLSTAATFDYEKNQTFHIRGKYWIKLV